MNLARSAALFGLWPTLLCAQQPQQPAPIGIIDFYGLRALSQADVSRTLPFHEGQSLPSAHNERKELLARTVENLKRLPGVADAQVTPVCCEQGRLMLYIGIQEIGSQAWHFADQPQGAVRLPAEVVNTGKKLDDALMQAVQQGRSEEDDSNGYALAKDPASRALQLQYVAFAAQYKDRLRDVLLHSSEAEQRAQAAEVLGYSADQQSVVSDLITALQDPDADVRNNAMRALGVMAGFAQDHPQTHLHIPADGFVEMLDSVSWTDRNKSAFVLLQLTQRRDPALLKALRVRALPSLIEMAQWNSDGHAGASFTILGRIEGLPEGEIEKAWDAGQRGSVIAEAIKLESADK